MRRVLAIARLTFREGIRMKIVLVFLVVLFFIVLRMPFALRGDDTLSGRLQTFLSYSLGALGIFLSLATVFLSCATLSNDIRYRSIHLVLTKPVSRFEVLLGKWLGINALNILLVILAALVIYAFSLFIKSRPELFPRDRVKLEEVIWTARDAARPKLPDFRKQAEEQVAELEKQGRMFEGSRMAAVADIKKQLHEAWRSVPPGENRLYEFEGIDLPPGKPSVVQVRFKAMAVPMRVDETVYIGWVIVDPQTRAPLQAIETQERASQRHQFLIRSNAVRDSKVSLGVVNPPDNHGSSIYFEGDDGLELLYRRGGFEWNYVKTLLLILFRLAFLSAIGIFFSTFVSFPVACFCVLSMFVFCIGVPWWMEAIGANMTRINPSSDPYGVFGPIIRGVMVPVLKILLPNFVEYNGVGKLIDGYAISPSLIWRGAAHTLIYGVVLLMLPGWLIFRSREIAQVIV